MIAASSAGMIGFGRGASTDMLVSAPFALAMMCWWTWHQTSKKLWLLLFYGLLGIGALAKGPVAPALAVLVVGAYAALRRDGKIFVRSLSVIGFLLFAAIVLPWYLAVQHKVPQFFRVFFIEHNLERFGTNLYQHSQPFWYYIPVFLLAALPWTFFALPALVEAGRHAFNRGRANNESTNPESANPESMTVDADVDDGLPSFLFVWIVVPIVFFSISRAKLPGYILPAIPAAALLTADYLHRLKAIPRLLTVVARIALRHAHGGRSDGPICHGQTSSAACLADRNDGNGRAHRRNGSADGPARRRPGSALCHSGPNHSGGGISVAACGGDH